MFSSSAVKPKFSTAFSTLAPVSPSASGKLKAELFCRRQHVVDGVKNERLTVSFTWSWNASAEKDAKTIDFLIIPTREYHHSRVESICINVEPRVSLVLP